MRAVFDPNVLVSATISARGAPRKLLHRWAGGAFELVVSVEILVELQEVLTRPKFRRYVTLEQVRDYVLWLHDHAAEVSEELPWDVVQGVTTDPDDDYIAGVAYLGQADELGLHSPRRRGHDSPCPHPPRLPRRAGSRCVTGPA